MLVPFTRLRRRLPSAGTPFLWLLAAAFMLRALLPAGYMPDVDALKRGDLAIAFCSADGTLTAVPFDDKRPAHGPDGQVAQAHCPFGALKPITLVDPPELTSRSTRVVLPLAAAALAPGWFQIRVAGPPLGSRAPPSELPPLLA